MRKRPLDSLIKAVGSPYGALLIVLFALLVLYPFLGYYKQLSWAFNLVSLGIVAAALRVTHGRGAPYYLSLLLGLSFFVADLLSRSLGMEWAHPYEAGLRVLFLGQLIVVIFTDIVGRRTVTMDAVLGASCIFVMLGLTFGSAYIMVEWLVPGSFSFQALPQSLNSVFGQSSTEYQLVYFSLVTMTTIGYGDIVPLAPAARSLASIEGLLSQLYLAIIIARLVGLTIASRLQNPEPIDE